MKWATLAEGELRPRVAAHPGRQGCVWCQLSCAASTGSCLRPRDRPHQTRQLNVRDERKKVGEGDDGKTNKVRLGTAFYVPQTPLHTLGAQHCSYLFGRWVN